MACFREQASLLPLAAKNKYKRPANARRGMGTVVLAGNHLYTYAIADFHFPWLLLF